MLERQRGKTAGWIFDFRFPIFDLTAASGGSQWRGERIQHEGTKTLRHKGENIIMRRRCRAILTSFLRAFVPWCLGVEAVPSATATPSPRPLNRKSKIE